MCRRRPTRRRPALCSVALLLAAPDSSALSTTAAVWRPSTTPLLEAADPCHILIDDTFASASPFTRRARDTFDARHGRSDRAATAENFRWEWWNVGSGQYSHLRTPCASFFGDSDEHQELYQGLCDLITEFGQKQLGMNSISPPWLSCYIDGCEQRLHTDAPHGPWAYVFSLTAPEALAAMQGGETMLLKPGVLDYWRGFDGFAMEEQDIFELVEPHFGRLVAFDPRLPHGVRQVRGPRAMEQGRVVIHGWFSDPEPFFTGGLAADEDPDLGTAAGAALDEALQAALASLSEVRRQTPCSSRAD